MRVRIHRGAHEIGGSCVEVESAHGDRLVLDVGAPLALPVDEPFEVPSIPGLIDPDPALRGVVITHGHQDHWGLLEQVHQEVPVYMGEATHRILSEAAFWVAGTDRKPAAFLQHRTPIELGAFRLTPFLNDHSAFDAYSLLVEGDGRRLFYTGDIRGHGRKSGIFHQLLRDPPDDVDVLLMEGTNIRPIATPTDESDITEDDVELACVERFRDTSGIVLAMYSAQNIDRMVTIYRAAKRTGRTLVMTLYGSSIAAATGNRNIPQAGWPKVRVIVPGWQQAKIKSAGAFERIDAIKPCRIFEEELAEDPSRWVVSFSKAMAPRLEATGCLSGARAIWSMWPGYLEDEKTKPLRTFLESNEIPMTIVHTSGHASVKHLQDLAAAIAAGKVVPIHSFGAARYTELFDDVHEYADGEGWEV